MTFLLKRLAVVLSLPLIIVTVGIVGLSTSVFAQAEGEKEVLYWYDPMYPQQKFDEPGKSPFMDMDLVPRYADEGGDGASMSIDPSVTQNLGMRLATATRESISQSLEATGALMFDERDVAVVQARSGGFVERVYDRAPEDVIEKGAPLADLLVPEWAAAQEEYLALKGIGQPQLLAAARQRLRLAGMPADVIAQLERTGKARPVWTVTSPIGGVLNSLDVREGMTVPAGASLARINGLDSVWLEVAVPEAQITNLAPGQSVTARLPAFAGETLEGTIQAVLSQANLDSRTVRVRVELPNPQQRLRPGMTAEVTLSRNVEDALVIPSEAVIRTGRRALVMLAENEGRYRPVEVRIGREFDDKTEVLDGLEAGQQVVASGQFLLDSEASLRGLTARGLEQTAPPVKPALHEAEGTIVSLEDGLVGLSHGPFKTLNMPGMTMSFPVADQSLLSGLQVDDRVRVGVRESDEGLVIERIEKLGGQQ
ncbi:efflux RND transporter periplasmic adaptor subunit [Pseudomonas stutzeri]|uniref:Efflux RND transporter periplasmic adaptor subunit n=1 Tax=Stutzerimonas stutzeri TaxID=316 RepID=A0A2N8SZ22_STUST|nr:MULTISPECIES: efflux RND transporter periplasmic adaptor subunit [Pseudomonadaceae]MCQ4251073.1 efflux RND transporter periplasmic adaptor subunit [Stutzerimonas stutzeri]MCQ4288247.1 efflux RND transporter periplasmic adaptor subunit [Stutzerimonas stutzeri]PNG07740.1 efflux RND transporter periplasmic adaptor subunit [Stutzerimonas stutzeri]